MYLNVWSSTEKGGGFASWLRGRLTSYRRRQAMILCRTMPAN